MRRAKRNAAKLLSAAMAVGMMAGMAVPAAAEEESTNIWASDVDTSEPMELKMYLIGDRTPDFDEVYGKINEILDEKLNCTLSAIPAFPLVIAAAYPSQSLPHIHTMNTP